MRSKILWAVVVITAMFLAIPLGHAQNNMGFRIGIAPSPPPMAVMQPVHSFHNLQQFGVSPFGVSPISSSGLVNTITAPVITNFLGSTHFHPGFAPFPAPGVILRPGTIVPNGGFIVGAPGPTIYAPGAVVVAPNVNVYAPTFVAPTHQPGLRRHERRLPAPGTPRAHVISQWGTPVVSILTGRGETLQYSGGVVIILQNGLVVSR